jgi:hypothetical protein
LCLSKDTASIGRREKIRYRYVNPSLLRNHHGLHSPHSLARASSLGDDDESFTGSFGRQFGNDLEHITAPIPDTSVAALTALDILPNGRNLGNLTKAPIANSITIYTVSVCRVIVISILIESCLRYPLTNKRHMRTVGSYPQAQGASGRNDHIHKRVIPARLDFLERQ